jgi:rod shape-determining protein MreD
MRRIVMAAVLLAVAVILQLTTVNGLRLPGGGVPDLALVVVAALGLASGPAAGAIAGFAAGLALDLAPPGSGVIGLYALVFVLVGWACGRLRPILARSAVLPIVIVALAAVAGELMVAGLSLALQAAPVSWAAIRQLLPAAAGYDVAISPFVLYLVLLAGAWLAEAASGRPAMSAAGRVLAAGRAGSAGGSGSDLAGRRGLAGPGTLVGGSAAGGAVLLGLGGWLAGPPEGRRARKAAARRTPRLRPGAGHQGDGWIGSSVASRSVPGRAASPGSGMRARAFRAPAPGAPGLGPGRAPWRRPGPGRASFGRSAMRGRAFRGQVLGGAVLGSRVPTGESLRGQAFRGRIVSGLPGGSGRPAASAARLRAGVAGSAAPGQIPRTLAARPVRLHLGGRRRGAVRPSRSLDHAAMTRLGRRRSRRAGGFRPSLMPGGSTAFHPAGGQLGPAAAPRIRATGRGRDGVVGGGALTRAGARDARPAAPRFRIRARPSAGLAGGRPPATPRFRARPLAGARPMSGKRPRFGYRRWRVLGLLTRKHGGRRQVWRINSRRPRNSA